MKDTYRHKTDWDFVEWLIEQLNAQLMTPIRKRQERREKARISVAKYRATPEGQMKRLEYARRYNEEHSSVAKRKRLERRLAEIKEELGHD